MGNLSEYSNKIWDFVLLYGPKLIGAILVWIIGGMVVKALKKAFDRMLVKVNTDASLRPFLSGIVGALLKLILVITVLGMFGVEMASFVAILAAAGLAVGLALAGTLQNFAGGVMILLFKPFKAGDLIEAQGYLGIVSEIQIFNTILKTRDNKTVIIPNGGLSTDSMVNYSTEPLRRVVWTIGIGYGDNADKAKEVITKLANADSRILTSPEPVFVEIEALADSSVNFTVRAWVKKEDYWGVYFEMNKKVYQNFEKEGLNIPFPQMDVHVHNQGS